MRSRPPAQRTRTDRFQPAAPVNDFLDRLDALVVWSPIQAPLAAIFTATTGRQPPPLVVFKLLRLQTCYGLSAPRARSKSATAARGASSPA